MSFGIGQVAPGDPTAWNEAVGAQLAVVKEQHEAVARAQAALLSQIETLQQLDDQRERAIGSGGVGVRFRYADEMQHRSLRAELALELRVTERAAEKLMKTAREVPVRLPDAYDAFEAGAISQRHLDVLAHELEGLEFQVQTALEQALLPVALTQNPARLEDRARAMREARNPQDAPERHRRAMTERGVFTKNERDGMASITIRSDAVRILAAKDRLLTGAHQLIDQHDPRTSQQLQSDLATETLLTGSLGDGSTWSVTPTVFITVPALTLLGRSDQPATLEGYGPIDVATAARYCAGAPSFRRVLTDPHSGAVLSLERDRYRITAALREFLILKAGPCDHPGCGMPAANAEADHTEEWQFDGVSAWSNLAMLCTGHHTLKSLGRWGYRHGERGALEWTTPSGRHLRKDPERAVDPLLIDVSAEAPRSPAPAEHDSHREVPEWEGEYLDDLIRVWEELEARDGPQDEPEPGFAAGFLADNAADVMRADEIDEVERVRRQRARADGRAYRPLGIAVALARMRETDEFAPRRRPKRVPIDLDAQPPF